MLETFAHLIVACVLGAVVGLERRLHGHPAGMRTQMIVAAAACLAMIVSAEVASLGKSGDAGRIAQSILAGIGFLGAGAVLKSGVTVQGLTTASSIWASASVGMAVGAGLVIEATAATAFIALGLSAVTPLEWVLTRRRELRRVIVHASADGSLLERTRSCLERHLVRVTQVGVAQNFDTGRVTLNLVTACPEKLDWPLMVRELGTLGSVTEVRIE